MVCVDCKRNVHLEHYFVKNEVWFDEAQMGEKGMLCVNCLEARIHRELNSNDFTNSYINNPKNHPMTLKLTSRIRNNKD